jgi:Ca2+/Na+ antiporter
MSDNTQKNALALQYRYLMLGGAFYLITIGLGLLLIVSFAIGEPIELIYETVFNLLGIGIVMLMQLMQIIGFIVLIPGILLLISGFLLKKIIIINTKTPEKEQRKAMIGLRIIKVIVFVSSIFLLVVIPIGTCIGINLIRESWMLKE